MLDEIPHFKSQAAQSPMKGLTGRPGTSMVEDEEVAEEKRAARNRKTKESKRARKDGGDVGA